MNGLLYKLIINNNRIKSALQITTVPFGLTTLQIVYALRVQKLWYLQAVCKRKHLNLDNCSKV